MSLLRSILAIHATTLRSALACALTAGAGAAYYTAIDWDDIAMATSAEAVTTPPVVRAAPRSLPTDAHHSSLDYSHAGPTADDLIPLEHHKAPPVVRAPQAEPLYTGSLIAPATEAHAAEAPPAAAADIPAPTPERSMLNHAWAPSEMLLPPKTAEKESADLGTEDPKPVANAHAAKIAPLDANAAKTMTVSAADPMDDEAMRAALRASVALEPSGESTAAPSTEPIPATVPIAADPSPGSAQSEPDIPTHDEDADIAPTVAKKPVARNAKPAKAVKRKVVKPQSSVIEEGFYSLQREISSFFD